MTQVCEYNMTPVCEYKKVYIMTPVCECIRCVSIYIYKPSSTLCEQLVQS